MLRALLLALLLANGVYLVWTQGLLAPYGFAPATQAEPERLALQIAPETLQLLGADPARLTPPPPPPAPEAPADLPAAEKFASAPAAAPVAAPAAAPVAAPVAAAAPPGTVCLQAGLFTEQEAHAMRPRLQASLPAGSWSFENYAEPVRWSIYMGKYISKEAMNRKRLMLQQMGLPFETPLSPQLNPGLSLGNFNTKAEAEAALAVLSDRGLRTARVVLERPELATQWLRLPAVNAALQSRLPTLKLPLGDKPLQPCRP